jgi:hypothetical protein
MKHWHLALNLMGIVGALSFNSAKAVASTAFYYGPSVPRELWVAYDQVVVEPEYLPDPSSIKERRAEPVAYLSVGEVSPQSRGASQIPPSWVLAKNPHWSSWVMDLTRTDYQQHVLRRFEALWQAGYHRFFLDTLDSYQLGSSAPEARSLARAALVNLVREMARAHPEVKLLLNRGFELLPEVAPLVHGVVAESLFDRWEAGPQRYTRVPRQDREWLLARLSEARDRYHLPVTVIDYRPSEQRDEARSTARQICGLGFEAWVADGALASVGVGCSEIIPRRVLILTNEPQLPLSAPTRPGPRDSAALLSETGLRDGAALRDSAALSDHPLLPETPQAISSEPLRWLAPVLEYLGYVPEERSLNAKLPEPDLAGRYQGVISWFSSDQLPAGYAAWLQAQIKAGVRVAIFGSPGFDLGGPVARALGIEVVRAASASGVRVTGRDELIGFEAEPPARPLEVPLLRFTGAGDRAHLRLGDALGGEGTAVATTRWGGMAMSHVFAARGLAGERAWVIDPFEFLRRALHLPSVPQPDVTTEQGRRIAMWLIRPPGLGERTRLRARPWTATVLKQLLLRQRWPHAFDLGSGGSSQALAASPADIAAAHELLELPFTEAAALLPGLTDAQGPLASLTRVQGMMPLADDGPVVAPIAPDAYYLPPNSPEAYPYARVRETLEFTGTPRRLKPILLDYHASVAASPGGLATLEQLYQWLETQQVYPFVVSEYAARVRAFRDQVVVRHWDGSFSLLGGEALRTVRVPVELGFPDLAASPSVASARRTPQGQYVSFKPGQARHLVLAAQASGLPHLVQANGSVQEFDISRADPSQLEIRFAMQGHSALSFEIAGLPPRARCQIELSGQRLETTLDALGTWTILLRSDKARGVLHCRGSEARS